MKRCLRERGGADRGSATVWSLGAIAVLCAVFGAVLALGQAVVVRHRAAGAADLAALAAADHWAEGGDRACARARQIAVAQGTRLMRCAIVGEISDVTAASGRGPFAAEVRARAGPAGALPTQPAPAGAEPPGVVPPRAPGLSAAGLSGPAPMGAGPTGADPMVDGPMGGGPTGAEPMGDGLRGAGPRGRHGAIRWATG